MDDTSGKGDDDDGGTVNETVDVESKSPKLLGRLVVIEVAFVWVDPPSGNDELQYDWGGDGMDDVVPKRLSNGLIMLATANRSKEKKECNEQS